MRLVILGTPPSVNHLYANAMVKGRRMRVLNSRGKQFFEDTKLVAMIWAKKSNWKKPEKEKKIIMKLWFYFPDKRRRDTHNCLKVLLDSLEGTLYEDDKTVLPRIMDYEIDRMNPRTEIEVVLVKDGE